MENSHLINIEVSEQYSSNDELENTYNLINNVFDNMKLTMKKFFNNLSLLDVLFTRTATEKLELNISNPHESDSQLQQQQLKYSQNKLRKNFTQGG